MLSRLLRHLQDRALAELPHWRRRIFFLCGGLMVGAAAVLMAKLADAAQDGWEALLSVSRLLALVVTPLGFGA